MREATALVGFLFLAILALCGFSAASRAQTGAHDINEGELHFLTDPPELPAHEQRIHVAIDFESLKSGWVRVKQCHHRLAAVGAMEVVFDRMRVRALRVAQADGIGRAWVEGASVQLVDVSPDAVLCILSENRALRVDPEGSYEWRGGP